MNKKPPQSESTPARHELRICREIHDDEALAAATSNAPWHGLRGDEAAADAEIAADLEIGVPLLPRDANLETILAAWHAATVRLEQTHAALRAEVCRLTNELEIKNRELARKNRLADLGQVAAHVAHEVRNSLVPVGLYLSLLRRRLAGDSESITVLDKVSAGFTALDVTVNDLLHFTSDREARRTTFNLRSLVEDVLNSLGPQLVAQAIATSCDVPPWQSVNADRHMLLRALLNLALNAVDAMPRGGTLTITSSAYRGQLELEVADSGPGMDDESLARAFEPFYTTKPGGTGLGLAIVGRIAEVHGGSVTAINCPEGGAALTLRLPQYTAMRAAA